MVGLVLERKHYWTKDVTDEGRVKSTFGSAIPRLENKVILDWGCNRGITTDELTKLYPRCIVSGLDSEEEYILDAQTAFPHIRFTHGDGFYLNEMYSERFGAIFAMNNFGFITEHLSDSQLERAMRNFSDSLENGGYLMISADEEYLIFRQGNGMQPIAGGVSRIQQLSWSQFEFERITSAAGASANCLESILRPTMRAIELYNRAQDRQSYVRNSDTSMRRFSRR